MFGLENEAIFSSICNLMIILLDLKRVINGLVYFLSVEEMKMMISFEF